MVEATILGGNTTRFGKRFLKFNKKYKKSSIICICEDVGNTNIIRTIERVK